MIRIAFIGSDSTHTEAFGREMNLVEGFCHGNARVVSIWGEDSEQTASKADLLKIERVCDSVDAALEDVDMAMVIGRFAESHYEPTVRALRKKIPVFVDKPFTNTLEEAESLAELVRTLGGRLCSSSPLRFERHLLELNRGNSEICSGVVSAPANCTDLGPDPRLQSVFFYGIHIVEMLLEAVGHEVEAIEPFWGKTACGAHLEIGGRTFLIHFVRDADEFYAMTLNGKSTEVRFTVELDGSYYREMLRFLLEDFFPGKATIPIESSVAAIRILEAIDRVCPKRRETSR